MNVRPSVKTIIEGIIVTVIGGIILAYILQVVMSRQAPVITSQPLPKAPELFIREYYTAINNRQYDLSWSMLSDDFKRQNHCCDAGGNFLVSPYIDWWDSIDRVEILTAVVQDSNAPKLKVVVNLRYNKNDGNIVTATDTFLLVPSGDSWLIDEQE